VALLLPPLSCEHPGAAGVDFLSHLLRHLSGKLLVVWDRLPAYRAGVVSDFIRTQRGWLAIEWLPEYAPDLNPVEYIWGHWKKHELPNFCPHDLARLSYQLPGAAGAMPERRHPRLVHAFWQQARLSL